MWAHAARLLPRAMRAKTRVERHDQTIEARPLLHRPRTVDADAFVGRVLALRVLLWQHERGETPFARHHLRDLSSALEAFVEAYELSPPHLHDIESSPTQSPLDDEAPGAPPACEAPPAIAECGIEDAAHSSLEKTDRPSRALSVRAPRHIEISAPASVRTSLRALDAAERFVEWVRLAGRCGEYSSGEFTKLYQEHCEAEDLIVLADNVLRPALLKLADTDHGIRKYQSDTGNRRRSPRVRQFVWRIDPAPEETVEVPWDELPVSTGRRVA